MPGRPLILDLRSRSSTICLSCLSRIQRRPAQLWGAAYSSQAPRARPRAHHLSKSALARRPSEAELKQYAQGIKDLHDGKKDDPNDFDVRYYEQDEKRRTELPDEQSFEQSLNKLDPADVKDGLGDMRTELRTQEEKEVFEEVVQQMGVDWGQVKTADDLERMIARMDAYSASIDAEIAETSSDLPEEMLDELKIKMSELELEEDGPLPQVSTPHIPERPWTLNQRRKITRLNGVIDRISREVRRDSDINKKTVLAVYKAYHAARLALARGWSNVPVDVWDFLWRIFSADETVNVNRLSHISMLSRDMSEAKVTLSPAQQLLTIEAVFVDGWESKAMDNWKRCISTLGSNGSETFKDFWELGVRMFCRTGDMEQAQRAVSKLLDRQMDPRILMPFIRTSSEQGTAEGRTRAWDAYRQMRELLGQNMKLKDYDQVVSYFLATNQTESALYAFVDMMSDGQIDLKKQKYMPSVIANKFFLGKWLKRLIGAGDLDGAFEVVEFMRKKGVDAAPIHLNGLIGAWQRSGGTTDMDRADTLAWGMIESRISFVRARDSAAGTESAAKSEQATWPRATLETFSLLAENYRLRNLHSSLQALWDAFRDAKISPDAFMINQLLESHIQAGQWEEALALYQSLVADRGVAPDPYTFSALWKTLAVNRLHVVAPEQIRQEMQTTRNLFAETVRFRNVFESEGMDGQLARKILHTFRRLKDNAGFLIAMAALKDIFKFLPPETLVLEMVIGTTKLSWDAASSRRRLMVAKRDMDRDLLAWAEGNAQKLEGERRGEALYEYLRQKYRPETVGGEERKVLADVAKEMGVYDLLAARSKMWNQ